MGERYRGQGVAHHLDVGGENRKGGPRIIDRYRLSGPDRERTKEGDCPGDMRTPGKGQLSVNKEDSMGSALSTVLLVAEAGRRSGGNVMVKRIKKKNTRKEELKLEAPYRLSGGRDSREES